MIDAYPLFTPMVARSSKGKDPYRP